MKTLNLKVFKVGEQEMTYKELVKMCVNNPLKEGFTADDMRKRQRVLDALDLAGDSLLLEDADSDLLKHCVAEMRWTLVNKDLLEFCDSVKAL